MLGLLGVFLATFLDPVRFAGAVAIAIFALIISGEVGHVGEKAVWFAGVPLAALFFEATLRLNYPSMSSELSATIVGAIAVLIQIAFLFWAAHLWSKRTAS